MRAAFEAEFANWRATKSSRRYIVDNRQDYQTRIKVLEKHAAGESLTPNERNWYTRYVCREVFGSKILYHRDKRVLVTDEVFDILDQCHHRIGHAGRNAMEKELTGYHGLSKEIIQIYLNCCQICNLKRPKLKKGIGIRVKPMRPITLADLSSRCQVDLVDLQSRPDGNYNFIMIYEDCLTKFVILRALRTNMIEEVSGHLIEIFATFGAPKVLCSENGQKFAKMIVCEVVSRWPDCKIVYGKAEKFQSEKSDEKERTEIGNLLTIWLRENNTTHWSEGLPHVQAMKNRRYNAEIKNSPYEAMFGRKMNLGYEKTDDMPTLQDEDAHNDHDESFRFMDGNYWLNVKREVNSDTEEEPKEPMLEYDYNMEPYAQLLKLSKTECN